MVAQMLFKHIVIPGFESLYKRRKTLRYLRELNRSQWMNREDIEFQQKRALGDLVAHAFNTTSYYPGIWKRFGFDSPEAVLEGFHQLPILSKDAINSKKNQIISNSPNGNLISKSTGGSTGIPLRFMIDRGSYERRNAAALRGYTWAGASIGTKQCYLWGGQLGTQSWRTRMKDSIYNSIQRRHLINCFELRNETRKYSDRLTRLRPDVIVAYTNAIYDFACRLEKEDIIPWSPSSIVVGAEKLFPFQREKIEQVFQAPVFETYGSREFMLVGAECELRQGLHLTQEHLLVEVLNEDGSKTADGCVGNVVITDLHNYGFPFIRYQTGDQAIAGFKMCECGRGLPLLREVKGRQLDVIHLPNGNSLPGEFFRIYLRTTPWFAAFR